MNSGNTLFPAFHVNNTITPIVKVTTLKLIRGKLSAPITFLFRFLKKVDYFSLLWFLFFGHFYFLAINCRRISYTICHGLKTKNYSTCKSFFLENYGNYKVVSWWRIDFRFLFRPLKMGRNFVFRVCFSFSFFLFLFHAKSGTSNNHRTGFSDISY